MMVGRKAHHHLYVHSQSLWGMDMSDITNRSTLVVAAAFTGELSDLQLLAERFSEATKAFNAVGGESKIKAATTSTVNVDVSEHWRLIGDNNVLNLVAGVVPFNASVHRAFCDVSQRIADLF